MPRKRLIRPPEAPVEVVEVTGPTLGALVTYYLEGWRYGYLDSVKGQVAKVRPIGPAGSEPRLVKVPLEDVKGVV